jgi:hypothetical protein
MKGRTSLPGLVVQIWVSVTVYYWQGAIGSQMGQLVQVPSLFAVAKLVGIFASTRAYTLVRGILWH